MTDLIDLTNEMDEIIASVSPDTLENYYKVILKNRILYNQPGLTDSNNYDHKEKLDLVSIPSQANLISSLASNGLYHYPVLDLDYDVFLVPSSPGKNHLLINKALTIENYTKLISVLTEVGIIQPGFGKQIQGKKATFIRRFNITKNNLYISNINKIQGLELYKAYKQLYIIKQILEKIIQDKDKLIKSQQQEILELKSQIGN